MKQPVSLRRANKHLMERRRRARINSSLEELKSLVLEGTKKDPSRHARMEKADILELTVDYLKEMKNFKVKKDGDCEKGEPLTKYKAGFQECAAEIACFMNKAQNVDNNVKKSIITHLGSCMENVKFVSVKGKTGTQPTDINDKQELDYNGNKNQMYDQVSLCSDRNDLSSHEHENEQENESDIENSSFEKKNSPHERLKPVTVSPTSLLNPKPQYQKMHQHPNMTTFSPVTSLQTLPINSGMQPTTANRTMVTSSAQSVMSQAPLMSHQTVTIPHQAIMMSPQQMMMSSQEMMSSNPQQIQGFSNQIQGVYVIQFNKNTLPTLKTQACDSTSERVSCDTKANTHMWRPW